MENPSDLVVAHRATHRAEAEIVRLVLEDAGILAVVPDRNVPLPVDLKPLDEEFAPAGCEVLVPARDLERAREAIAAARSSGELIAEDEAERGATEP